VGIIFSVGVAKTAQVLIRYLYQYSHNRQRRRKRGGRRGGKKQLWWKPKDGQTKKSKRDAFIDEILRGLKGFLEKSSFSARYSTTCRTDFASERKKVEATTAERVPACSLMASFQCSIVHYVI